DDPAHRGIMGKDVRRHSHPRIRQAAQTRIAETFRRVRGGRSCRCVRRRAPSWAAEDIVEFTIGQKFSIGSDNRSAKLENQPAIENEPENPRTILGKMKARGSTIKSKY